MTATTDNNANNNDIPNDVIENTNDSADAALAFAEAFTEQASDDGQAGVDAAAAAAAQMASDAAVDTDAAASVAEWDFTDPATLAAEAAAAAELAATEQAADAAAAQTQAALDAAQELEKTRAVLEQRLRSAQGRLAKDPSSERLAAQVAQLTGAIESLTDPASQLDDSAAAPASAAPALSEVVPDGWTAEEWREFIQDYPDDAQAILAAQVPAAEAQAAADAQAAAIKQERDNFLKPIVAAHPDYHEIVSAANWPKFEQFVAAIDDDVKRAGAMRIIESGSAAEIIALVSQFKTYRKPPPPNQGEAVRTRGTQPKPAAGGAGDESFAAGFNS